MEKRNSDHLVWEQDTLAIMIGIYCKNSHDYKGELCPECNSLLTYCLERLANCPWSISKPVCSKCTIHCYAPVYRKKIKQVMRFAGPRMIAKHPLRAVQHLWKQIKN